MSSVRLAASQLATLSRQLGRISLREQQHNGFSPSNYLLPKVRCFAAKTSEEKSISKMKVTTAKEEGSNKKEIDATLQHQEWIKFQQSIAVEGFETGQTVKAKSTRKTRGGKALTRRRAKLDDLEEKAAERQRLTDVGGGQYPPMRYSQEETERLLAQAYASIPERAGKRGTRNLNRQKRRWFLVRKIRKKYKKNMAKHQERKMEKRKLKMANIRAVLEDAPVVRARDRAYQASVLRRWTETMVQVQQIDEEGQGKSELKDINE